MEVLEIEGIEYKGCPHMTNTQHKFILYNDQYEVFVFENKKVVALPEIDVNHNQAISSLISFDETLECMLKIINYKCNLETVNNKLKKNYLKEIKNYYTFCTQFSFDITQFGIYTKKGEILTPKVLFIDDILECFTDERCVSQTEIALKKFNQKIKERKIC